MTDIWLKTKGEDHIKSFMATIYRVVESQEKIATMGLVNNVHEQGILESLLESTKNPLMDDTCSLHYLLATPFRYPPLKNGSRFGTAFERGIFYGSLNLQTALCETAYYRFVYILGPVKPYEHPITNEYSSFAVKVRSSKGIFLDQNPFSIYESILTSPTSYSETQQLGAHMRESDIEVFQYNSARDTHQGKNAGVFTPMAFQSKTPARVMQWICQTSINETGFITKDGSQATSWSQSDFWIENTFPSPAV